MQKRLKLSHIKTCDCFMLWSASGQFSGHDQFLIRYKEFYNKTATKNLELIIYKKLASKLMQKDERYKISKIMIALYHGKVSTNSLAMTTQFL